MISMRNLFDRRDPGNPGTVTTSVTADIIERRDQSDQGIEMISMRIRLTEHQDPEDPGTGTTSTGADPIGHQDSSVLGTEMISMRIRPTDH